MEVITPDNCNVMFVNNQGNLDPPNPCIKYWRSFIMERGPVDLVDQHINYHIPTPFPPGPPDVDGAMYIVTDVTLNSSVSHLDLNGNALYYGGTLLVGDGTITDGRVARLIKTTYGDFNGDCTIDEDDQDIFDDALGASGSIICYPLADANGDCEVDGDDEDVFNANKAVGGNDRCWCENDDNCTWAQFEAQYPEEDLVLSCPLTACP